MPASLIKLDSNTLLAGLSNAFMDSLRREQESLQMQALAKVMRFNVPTQLRTQVHGYWESTPHPRRVGSDETHPYESMTNRTFSVPNHEWKSGLEWRRIDREDMQLGDVMTEAAQAGQNYMLLNERVFFQYLTNATDADLIPSVPNAADGAALFSATDGDGGDRFGVSGGNSITGDGVGAPADIRTNFWEAVSRMGQFEDTKGQPFYKMDQLKSFTIIYGNANEEVFREAFLQARTLDTAAVTNTILESGYNITLVSSPRITTNDWSVWYDGSSYRAVFEQTRDPLSEMRFNESNSRKDAEEGTERILWRSRSGFGIALPRNAVLIDNV